VLVAALVLHSFDHDRRSSEAQKGGDRECEQRFSHGVRSDTMLVDGRSLVVARPARLPAEYAGNAGLEHAAIARRRAILLIRLLIERAQRVDDLVKGDELVATRCSPQRRDRLDRAGV
jgi:hypothetical protein